MAEAVELLIGMLEVGVKLTEEVDMLLIEPVTEADMLLMEPVMEADMVDVMKVDGVVEAELPETELERLAETGPEVAEAPPEAELVTLLEAEAEAELVAEAEKEPEKAEVAEAETEAMEVALVDWPGTPAEEVAEGMEEEEVDEDSSSRTSSISCSI